MLELTPLKVIHGTYPWAGWRASVFTPISWWSWIPSSPLEQSKMSSVIFTDIPLCNKHCDNEKQRNLTNKIIWELLRRFHYSTSLFIINSTYISNSLLRSNIARILNTINYSNLCFLIHSFVGVMIYRVTNDTRLLDVSFAFWWSCSSSCFWWICMFLMWKAHMFM